MRKVVGKLQCGAAAVHGGDEKKQCLREVQNDLVFFTVGIFQIDVGGAEGNPFIGHGIIKSDIYVGMAAYLVICQVGGIVFRDHGIGALRHLQELFKPGRGGGFVLGDPGKGVVGVDNLLAEPAHIVVEVKPFAVVRDAYHRKLEPNILVHSPVF